MCGPSFILEIDLKHLPMKYLATPLAILLLIVVGAAAYWPGVYGGFIFDDIPNLVADPDWKVTTMDLQSLRRAMTLGISSDLGRPLALLSFAINHYFTGLDPLPLKLTGLAMHLLNGALVLLLCRRLFALTPTSEPRTSLGAYAALLIALAWTLHPLQVSTVLYVVQRMEIGAHTGVLLALICYLQARRRQIERKKAWPWFLLTGASTLLGLGFKETAALVPGYSLILELTILKFRTADNTRSRPLITIYTAGLIVVVTLFLIVGLPRYLPEAAYAFRDFSLGERLLTQLNVLLMYLGQAALPIPDTLLFYYDNFQVSTSLFAPPSTLFGLVVLLALAACGYLARSRWPLVSLGIGWFFISHALTSNIIPLELAFEHRNYFALLGLLIAGAQILSWTTSSLHLDARRTLATLPILFLITLCSIQASTWGEPLRLGTALATRNPDSVRASYTLAITMYERAGADPASPLFSLAVQELEHASRLPSSNPLPEQALIVSASRANQEVPTEVWQRLQSKLEQRRAGPEAINALHGVLDCRQRNLCEFDDQKLLRTLLIALEQNPKSPVVHVLYASFAYNVAGEQDLGIRMMQEAIDLAPDNLQYKANMARFLAASGSDPERLSSLIDEIQSQDALDVFKAELATGFRNDTAVQQ